MRVFSATSALRSILLSSALWAGVPSISPELSAAEIFVLEVSGSNESRFAIDGEIEKDDYYKVNRYISDNARSGSEVEIYLNSWGGDADEGMRLGRYFKEKGFKTFVLPRGRCESACSLAFLGGSDNGGTFSGRSDNRGAQNTTGNPDRTKPHGSSLGVHFYSFNMTPDKCYPTESIRQIELANQRMFVKFLNYFVEMKVDISIMEKIVGTSSGKMYYLDAQEAFKYDIKVGGMTERWAESIREAYRNKKFPQAYKVLQ